MGEKRMYALVLRQLDGINKGIQVAHACMEYAEKYHDRDDWKQYVNTDKTMIVLNGGVTQDLIDVVTQLNILNHPYAEFREPDLGNVITAIVFILDEQIFNKKDYPNFVDFFVDNYFSKEIRIDLEEAKKIWTDEVMGGETNVALREIIEPLHFAK